MYDSSGAPLITLTFTCRVRVKKNSRRIFNNRYTGRVMNLPSEAHERWYEDASHQIDTQLRQQREETPELKWNLPMRSKVHVSYRFVRTGKAKVDVDNLIASLNDLLVGKSILADDAQIVQGDFLIVRTIGKESEDSTSIQVVPIK